MGPSTSNIHVAGAGPGDSATVKLNALLGQQPEGEPRNRNYPFGRSATPSGEDGLDTVEARVAQVDHMLDVLQSVSLTLVIQMSLSETAVVCGSFRTSPVLWIRSLIVLYRFAGCVNETMIQHAQVTISWLWILEK